MSVYTRTVDRKGWPFWVLPPFVRPLLNATTKRTWSGGDNIPTEGGVIVVANHVTKIDPITILHFLYDHGRLPRFLTKDSLFDVKGLGGLLREAGQIPVARRPGEASEAYAEAIAALGRGECVVIYPEGSITRDPDLWPMRGKTGAARLALESGAPVIPIGHWGEQDLLPSYGSKPRLFPPTEVAVRAGRQINLRDLTKDGMTPESVTEATERIMAAITVLVEELRGQMAPETRFDPRAEGISETGNPAKG